MCFPRCPMRSQYFMVRTSVWSCRCLWKPNNNRCPLSVIELRVIIISAVMSQNTKEFHGKGSTFCVGMWGCSRHVGDVGESGAASRVKICSRALFNLKLRTYILWCMYYMYCMYSHSYRHVSVLFVIITQIMQALTLATTAHK